MKNFAWIASALAVCVVTVGCSDGHPCKLTQDAEGAAVISCPDGSTSRVLPGRDGDEIAERCEIEVRDNVSWIVCGELQAPLPTDASLCAMGLKMDLIWPPYEGEDYTRWQLFEELQCDVLLGSLIIGSRVNDLPESVQRLREVDAVYVDNVNVGERLALPNLQTIASGSLSIYESRSLKEVSLTGLRSALNYVSVTDAVALESLSLGTTASVDSLSVSNAPNLKTLSITASSLNYARITALALESLSLRVDARLESLEIAASQNPSFSVTYQGPTADYLWVLTGSCMDDSISERSVDTIRTAIPAQEFDVWEDAVGCD